MHRTKKPLVNYLDDFLFISFLKYICNLQLQVFLHICELINFPVSAEKTESACTCIVFLGFLIDTVNQIIGIPMEKITRAVNMIQFVLNKCAGKPKHKRKMTVLQLQRICGFLNFLGRAIIPGRAFTRRLYAHLQNKNLKQHHHLHITNEMMADLEMWLQFVQHPSIYCRPFMDFSKFWDAEELRFYSDASKTIGFGSYCKTSWMQGFWCEDEGIAILDPSIAYLELFALVAAVLHWIQKFSNKRVIIFTDNTSVMTMVNNTTSSCKNCMVLIRVPVLKCLIHNVRVFAKYVNTRDNEISDALSRGQMSRLCTLTRHLGFDKLQTPIPEEIWPITKIWLH